MILAITLSKLLIGVAIAAAALTAGVGVLKNHKSWLMTYLQNFCGALFIFSGWVKAVDPLGTAYKMEQYFGEFTSTFEGTWMSFIAPIFPWLANYVTSFSVFMIVLEIVLGIMLILGMRSKLTSWLFLGIVAFFTFLTGFTYLTGYVPADVNFFSFGSWGPYVESNMKVTDCGCFGDFLKLKPKVSFFKDVFLMIPALYFVFKHKDMHQLFNGKIRTGLLSLTTVGLLIYCFSNFVWDIPGKDFRPFKKGVDVAGTLAAEKEAAGNVQVVAYKLTNKATGVVTELPYADFMKKYKDYPKEDWEYDQIKSEPAIEATKISDFALESVDGKDMTDAVLSDPKYSFMIVSYKLKYDEQYEKIMVNDTVFVTDTIMTPDTTYVTQKVASVNQREAKQTKYIWDTDFQKNYREKINPLAAAAEKDGFDVYAIVGGAGPATIDEFRHATQTAFPFYMADDILLKTIVRSNPGVVLLKDGKIIDKWHHKQLPSYAEIKQLMK